MAAKRGFALLDPSRRSEIAKMGGEASSAAGTAHRFSPDEAREAGRKGGMKSKKPAVRNVAKDAKGDTLD